jgi:membrane-associated HD superfamily phosphohydrolase
MKSSYSLRREIKDFSRFEYEHALKVSYFSGKAAFMIGADTLTAKAGGMYYRFPKLFDKEITDEPMKIMENHCFPKEVMDIVYEYGGELRKPSSPESAIVHMIDSVITRIELLDEDTMKSSWNQDMVIYSILNELSGKGIYDESGLSLNQYLKIRDYLVNENLLINIEED